MNVIFRVDASSTMGTGHVMRCLTLARALAQRGATCVFICRAHPGNCFTHIHQQGFSLLELPLPEKHVITQPEIDDKPLAHASWLGIPWLQDITDTKTILAADVDNIDWLIVDHYALDARWESAMRSICRQIMVIDDLEDRAHDCDVLLNQNILPGTTTHYRKLVPPACRLLLGPSFALLQSSYQLMRRQTPPRSGNIKRVLVYFGGVDAANLTGRSLEAFIAMGLKTLDIDVVLPFSGPHREAICLLAAQLPGTHIHDTLPSLSRLMVMADLAIGAGGTTSWERLCLGLPSLIITLSDNQVNIAKGLHEHHLAHWVGHYDRVSVSDLIKVLEPLLTNELPTEWSMTCQAVVDGAGASRITEFLSLNAQSRLSTRQVEIQDEQLLVAWATPLFTTTHSHHWFRQALRTLDDQRWYVCEINPGVIISATLCTKEHGQWHLRSVIAPASGAVICENTIRPLVLRQLRADEPGLLLLATELATTTSALTLAVCSDQGSWINEFIPHWIQERLTMGHAIAWAHDATLLTKSHFCFYFSYSRIVDLSVRSRHHHNVVVHESALPAGRGWSPLTWQVLDGERDITVTLFEAVDAVDAGTIYLQTTISLLGDELVDELREKQAQATFALCHQFLADYPAVVQHGREQHGTPSYYQRRKPIDSQLDLNISLKDQFNLMRVCDNARYPAWFEFAGKRYSLQINRLPNGNGHNDHMQNKL